MKNAINATANKGIAIAGAPPAQIVASFKELVDSYHEFKKIREIELTKRKQITSWRDTQLSKIDAQKKLVEMYLTATFKERAEIFNEAFSRLDKALAELSERPEDTNALKAVDACLGIIAGQIKQSPLAGLYALMQSMENESGTLEI